MKAYLFALLIFIGLNSFAQTRSRGVPASPYPFIASQPDSSQITLIPKGDGVVHWFETEDGYTVLKTKTGWYNYATINSTGEMVSSNVSVSLFKGSQSSLKITQISFPKHLRFSPGQIRKKKLNYFGEESRNKASTIHAFPSLGKRKSLLILAEFEDLPHKISKEKFDNLMNQGNYNGTGSFRDYYLEASYNKLDITTTTTVWVKVPKKFEYYGKNDEEGQDVNPKEFIRHAIDAAEAQGVDFSQYDNDGDGYAEAIQVIHSGYGEEAGASDNAIWSHSWSLGSEWAVKYDGVWINKYVTFPELRFSAGSYITNIGVICHEFGHGMGLEDYYDTSDKGDYAGDAAGLGDWDIMAGGSWNNHGSTPAHHNSYSKYLLGWLELKEFQEDGQFSINNLANNPEAYIIKSKTENEFFILENRQKTGFDLYIPHHGMLIYHVDRNFLGWNSGKVNADPDHEGMDLLEADNNDVLNEKADPFPGTGNVTLFNDLTTPGSLSWAGVGSDIEINNITESNSVISFNYAIKEKIKHTIKFVIKDEEVPVEGIEVNFNGQTNSSNSLGEVFFYDVVDGSYPYSISKSGFKKVNDVIDVEGEMELIEIPVDLEQLLYTVKFVVKDVKGFVEGAEVEFKGSVYYTNSLGEVKFGNISLGEYAYEVNKSGYYNLNKNISIEGTNAIIEVPVNLEAYRYTVVFSVKEGNALIQGAEVTFNGNKSFSNNEGKVSFNDVIYGNYEYAVKKYGYYPITKNISIKGEDEVINININFLALAVVEESQEIKIYPNPTTGMVYIDGCFSPSAIIKVVNLKGGILMTKNLGDSIKRIDLSNLLPGIYNILIVDRNKKIQKQVIVK